MRTLGIGFMALCLLGVSVLPAWADDSARLAAIEQRLEHGRELVHIDLPLAAGRVLAWLRRSGKVLEEAYTDTAVSVTALISHKVAGQLRKLLAVEHVR